MKYWLLTSEFPPLYGGGIGTYCQHWCTVLKNQGQEVTVFIPDREQTGFKKTVQEGITVIRFSPYFSNTAAFLGYETMVSMSFSDIVEQFIKEEGTPDWIEAQEYNGIAYYILQKKHLGYQHFTNLNILITCHCPSFLTFHHNHINPRQLPYFWIGEMERFCIKAADVCISPSNYLLHQLTKFHPSLSRECSVVPNPYLPILGKKKGGSLNHEVLFIGKLSPAKGVLQALNVFTRLWESGSLVHLKLIGDENYYYHAMGCTTGTYIRRKYQSYIQQGLLQIAGVLPPSQVDSEITQAKCIIVPSTIENLPYTVIECMAAKKVVLAAVQGGQCELIQDGVNGFLFDHNNEHSFFEKLVGILSLAENELEKVGEQAAVTILQRCNPVSVFTEKLGILNSYAASEAWKTSFPFVIAIPLKENQGLAELEEVKGLLSVVIPFYNLGDYLVATIESVKASSYPGIEIIIVNDGSSQAGSIEVLESYSSDDQVIIVTQENTGLANARNRGSKEARGEFIAFLDADDQITQNYYSKAITLMREKSNVHFAGSWVQYFESAQGIWPTFNPEPPYLLYHNMVNSSGLVYRRKSFLSAGCNDRQFVYGMEDYDSVINLVKNGYRGVIFPEPLFLYRVRKNSMARGFNRSNMSYLYGLLSEKHKEFYATFAAEITDLLNVNGPGYTCENPTLDYHLHPGTTFYDRTVRKMIVKVKQHPRLRKLALAVYKIYKS